MNKVLKIIIGIVVLMISLLLLAFSYYIYELTPVSSDDTMIEVEIPKGSTGSKVGIILKNNNLIRDVNVFKLYLKVHNVNTINYGTYKLNRAMGVKKVVDIISSGKYANANIKLLFKEGLNMRGIAKVIANNTDNSEEDVFSLLKDVNYIDSLIDEYWFLTDDIKNKDIYYPLEGYLAPNTYQFASKDVTVKEIFKTMLDQTDKVLTPYKNKIKNYTFHQFLTLASIVESEGVNDKDRPKIASVFYNRLEKKMAFGSCVTACYATKTDNCISDNVNTKYNSPYNTYLSSMAGKLPVGPVSNPGATSIETTINPADTDYLFFLADKYKNTYFFKTYEEHQQKQAQLEKNGEWLEVNN
jgi:UPF0755 protein